MSDWRKGACCYTKSGIPHVALQPLISQARGDKGGEGVCAWAMLPYLVIWLVLGSVTKHKGEDRTDRLTGCLPAYLPTCHDRALSVLHLATRAPGHQARYRRGRHRMIHLVGRPRSTE